MLQLFSVATHEHLGEWLPPLSGCDYNQIRAVALSPEADILFGYSHCGFDSDRGQLVWTKMDEGAIALAVAPRLIGRAHVRFSPAAYRVVAPHSLRARLRSNR